MRPMLASDYSGISDDKEYVVEAKIDGYRIIATSNGDGSWVYSSRNGGTEPWTRNLSFMDSQLGKKPRGFIYDGELVNVNFERTGSVRKKKMSDTERSRFQKVVRFYIFDAFAPGTKEPLWQRIDRLTSLREGINVRNIPYLGVVSSEKEILRLYKKAIAKKFEGVMIKDLDGTYSPGKRTRAFQKLKAVTTHDAKVLEVLPGSGKYKGAMGALVVAYKGKKLRIGTGFSDKERVAMWRKRDAMLGKWIEFSTQKGTRRSPVFYRLRDDKT